jgi:hypothetical protein
MSLSRALGRFRTWCSAGVAILTALAMFVQPFCAPICGARHCAAEAGVGAAMMHCSDGSEQPQDSIAAQGHTCPTPCTFGGLAQTPSRHQASRPVRWVSPLSPHAPLRFPFSSRHLRNQAAVPCPLRPSFACSSVFSKPSLESATILVCRSLDYPVRGFRRVVMIICSYIERNL